LVVHGRKGSRSSKDAKICAMPVDALFLVILNYNILSQRNDNQDNHFTKMAGARLVVDEI
jgi:hypothetical protein